jgi:hypothetical protein
VGGRGVYPGSAYLSQTRQGYDGAPAPVYGTDYGSGGGGAGAAGQYLSVNGTTNGGIGIQSSITGSAVYYGGGGGGGIGSGAGGTGGGGNKNTAGTTNTGGGGGGASDNNGQGGNGGSGVVILKINGSAGNVSITGTPPDTIVGSGYTVYKFTSSGSITFN